MRALLKNINKSQMGFNFYVHRVLSVIIHT